MFGYLAEELEAAQKRRDLAARAPAAELAWTLASALIGFLVIDPRPDDPRRTAAHGVLELILRSGA